MVVSLAVADLRVVRIDLLPNGPAGNRTASQLHQRVHQGMHWASWYVLVSVDSHHGRDTALIVPRFK